MTLFISALASLISVVNPIGAIPVFLSLTPHDTAHERNKTAIHTSIYFFLILISFFLAGSYILSFFGISINALRIAGGMVILSSGFALLNGKFAKSRAMSSEVRKEALEKEDISFAPMAMPMLSGPGSISLLIAYYAEYNLITDKAIIAGVVFTSAVIIYFILRASPLLFKFLGVTGLKSISRIMGFIVMAIGIQYIITGVVSLVNSLI